MSRKRMVTALTEIYQQTHQYETDTSAEWTMLSSVRSGPQASRESSDRPAGRQCQRQPSAVEVRTLVSNLLPEQLVD